MSNAQNMELFLKFLNLIPTDILEQSICNVSFNRENKRKFERFKNLNDKLKMIIKSSSNRCILISDIHNLYNSNFTLPQDLSYEDTLALFNKSNGINLTLHILKKCTDKDYDEQYFSDFMKSNQFYKTIKNEWGDTESTYNKIEPVININISKENNNMEYYLGFIELNKTFYNFIPKFLLKNNKLIELSQSQMQEDFYVDGKICLSYKNRYAESYKFLEKLDINRNEDSNKGYKGIYIVIFDKNELLPNNNEFIQYKLDLEILLESGIDLRDRIKLPQ